MAKFCTKCGRRLIDGQPCSCTQTQQPVHDMQGSVQKEVKDKAKNFFTQALEMIKHPSTGFVEAVSDKDSKNGLILMGIEAVLTGLYLYVLLQKIVSATMSGINSVFGTSRTAAQTPSLGGFFGYGIIIAIIVSLVIAALAAQGITRIRGCCFIERGYEHICEDLTALGGLLIKDRGTL